MRLKPSHLLMLMASTLGLTVLLTRRVPAPGVIAGASTATACQRPPRAA